MLFLVFSFDSVCSSMCLWVIYLCLWYLFIPWCYYLFSTIKSFINVFPPNFSICLKLQEMFECFFQTLSTCLRKINKSISLILIELLFLFETAFTLYTVFLRLIHIKCQGTSCMAECRLQLCWMQVVTMNENIALFFGTEEMYFGFTLCCFWTVL